MTVNELLARTPAKIALIAHDGKKQELVSWAKKNKKLLSQHYLYGTGNTGALITQETGLFVSCFKSGPLGGDQQIGAKIVEGTLDALIFFWDPLSNAPHEHDVKALERIAVLYNIPAAFNQATADFIFSDPRWLNKYETIRTPLPLKESMKESMCRTHAMT